MNAGDFVSAGFLVTRRFPRPSFAAPELLPATLVSAAPDLATFLPAEWAIAWCGVAAGERRGEAAKLGIAPERVDEVVARVTTLIADGARYGWPNVCHTLEAAREVIRVARPAEPAVLELGLERLAVPAFLEASEPPQPLAGSAPIGEQGVRTAVRRNRPLSAGGRRLGFEPLVFYHTLGCSWLCNGLERLVARELGIRPNASGLLADAGEAHRAAEYISRDDVGAEPGLWLPWLLVEHST